MLQPFGSNQPSTAKLKEVAIKPSKLDPAGGSPQGRVIHDRLQAKMKTSSHARQRARKPFRPPKEDDSSEADLRTERAYMKKGKMAASVGANPKDIQSNIDGFSQSDLWETESKGYLENSRKLLGRLKKNPDSEYGKSCE